MSKVEADIAFEKLFFSKTYDFLETFLPKQACRSRHTVKQYKTGLSRFYDYVSEVRMISPLSFAFVHCTYQLLLEYKQYMADTLGHGASTINCRIAAIRSYLEYVSQRGSHRLPFQKYSVRLLMPQILRHSWTALPTRTKGIVIVSS